MVGSAVLGAATGTGLALVVAMTIVIYRYYKQKRYGKEWGNLDRGVKTKGGYSVLQKVSHFMRLAEIQRLEPQREKISSHIQRLVPALVSPCQQDWKIIRSGG